MFVMDDIKSNNYDDFDMVKLEGENTNAGLFSPFTFIFFFMLIVLSGLLMLYSSTFDVAVRNGHSHYYYLFNQVIGVGIGLLVGSLLNFVSIKVLRGSYYFLCPVAIILLVLALFPQFNDRGILVIMGYRVVSTPILGVFAVISLISGAIPSIYKLKEANGFFFALVLLVSTAIAILSAFVGGMGYYFLIVIISLLMLYSSGARKSFIIISGIFSVVTGLFLAFVVSSFSADILQSIFPVPDPDFYNHNLFASQLAIRDGGLTGIGIGKGLYKLGILSDVEGNLIFSSIAEEIGLIGILFFFIVFLNYFFLGMMASRRAYKKDNKSISGAALGISSLIIVEAILSALYCCGLFPFGSLALPFFSYCPGDEAMFIIASLILYRYIHMMGRPNAKSK